MNRINLTQIGIRERLKSAWSTLVGAITGRWLARMSLKDRYGKREAT
jgi:hypothetical protein